MPSVNLITGHLFHGKSIKKNFVLLSLLFCFFVFPIIGSAGDSPSPSSAAGSGRISLSTQVPAGKPFIIQINDKGEKTVFFPHSGLEEPDLKTIRSGRFQSDTLALDIENSRRRESFRIHDYMIAKSENTNFQKGTVGTSNDLSGNPLHP